MRAPLTTSCVPIFRSASMPSGVLTIAAKLIKLTTRHVSPFVNDIAMSRFVRHLLFGSVIACHAVVTLCGPCLHACRALRMNWARRPNRSDRTTLYNHAVTRRITACFATSSPGQLLAASSTGVSNQPVAELVGPVLQATYPAPVHLPSSPRLLRLVRPICRDRCGSSQVPRSSIDAPLLEAPRKSTVQIGTVRLKWLLAPSSDSQAASPFRTKPMQT